MNPQGAPMPPGGGFGGGPGGPGGPRGGLFMLPPAVMLGLVLLGAVVMAIAFWQIFRKAGYSGVLGLLMMVPIVNFGVMLWFAFKEWPILKQLREAKAIAALSLDPGAPAVAAVAPAAPEAPVA